MGVTNPNETDVTHSGQTGTDNPGNNHFSQRHDSDKDREPHSTQRRRRI